MRVTDISNQEIVTRELALIKVCADTATRGEVIQIVHLFRANIVDVGAKSVMIEITGEEDKINALHDLLEPFGIIEMLRTGLVAMVRGQSDQHTSDSNRASNFGPTSNGHSSVTNASQQATNQD